MLICNYKEKLPPQQIQKQVVTDTSISFSDPTDVGGQEQNSELICVTRTESGIRARIDRLRGKPNRNRRDADLILGPYLHVVSQAEYHLNDGTWDRVLDGY